MTTSKRWTVDIVIGEDGQTTHADVRLRPGENAPLRAEGTARCNPADVNVPEIGDELAVARALSDLSHQLLHAAATDIESVTHEPAPLRG